VEGHRRGTSDLERCSSSSTRIGHSGLVASVQRESDQPEPEGDPAGNASRLSETRSKVSRRYEGSFAQALFARLGALDFMNQAILFGSGVLLSLLPFLVLLSAFANERVDDDLALHLGLDHRAATIVSHLFTQHGAKWNQATAISLVVMLAGTITVVSALQEIYEKAFDQPRRGMRNLPRFLVWIVVMAAIVALPGVLAKPTHALPDGFGLLDVLTLAIFVPFVWWTMHFLLAGRVGWRRLFPSAVATGLFGAVFGVFSTLYFSSTIISDDRIYGPIGAVFDIVTWLVGIGAVIILGAVAGVVWQDRREAATPRA
jgi:membrane protein